MGQLFLLMAASLKFFKPKNMTTKEIIEKLPFSAPYLFVDELHYVNENEASGSYTFSADLDFFKGHFNGYPIVPGAILTETMAQIGLVSLGIYLMSLDKTMKNSLSVATSYNVEFFKPVFPNEKVTVLSKKIYFRFGKLKSKVEMFNQNNVKVCEGTIAGILVNKELL